MPLGGVDVIVLHFLCLDLILPISTDLNILGIRSSARIESKANLRHGKAKATHTFFQNRKFS